MRRNGQKFVSKPASKLVVFPRDDEPIAFRVMPILSYDDFHKYCPEPTNNPVLIKGGKKEVDTNHPTYTIQLQQRNQKLIDWMTISSIKFAGKTEDTDEPIEWEKVDLTKPETWNLWEEEFKDSGITQMELRILFNEAQKINSLTQDRMDEARDSFLASPDLKPEEPSSPITEQIDTPSSEPVNGSTSDHLESLPVGTT